MNRAKILLLAICLALVSFLAGAYTCYVWLSKDSEKALADNILTTFIPKEMKEIALLGGIAQGLDATSSSETRIHMCRLINIKVSGMKETVRLFAIPYAPNHEELLKPSWSAAISDAESMSKAAKCGSESRSNASVNTDAAR